MSPTVSVQGKCSSVHSKNIKGDHDLEQGIFKFRISFDGIVSSKKLFSQSINRIKIHFDVIVEDIEVQISVSFEFYLDEEFVKCW